MRVVVTYTTIPGRYDDLYRSVRSILDQTVKPDAIYIGIPKISKRLKKEYPPLSKELLGLVEEKSITIVESPHDYGPATKIFGALHSEIDPDTLILSCDDDVIFEKNHLEVLVNLYKLQKEKGIRGAITGTGILLKKGLPFLSIVSSLQPFNAYKGISGFDIPEGGRNVDLVFGVSGVLYERSMFPEKDKLHDELFAYALEDDDIFMNDDILISAYLEKNSIKRRIYNGIPTVKHNHATDALSGDFFKMLFRSKSALDKMMSKGWIRELEPLNMEESPTVRVYFVLILILIMIFLAVSYITEV